MTKLTNLAKKPVNMAKPVAKPDFELHNDGGSVCILVPMTEAAEEWLDKNVRGDETISWGPGVVIEFRYIWPILEGIEEAGLRVG